MLVIGCPSQEIGIQKCLKQGDPMAHFLFLLVAEGLSCLISMTVDMGLLIEFRIRDLYFVVSNL